MSRICRSWFLSLSAVAIGMVGGGVAYADCSNTCYGFQCGICCERSSKCWSCFAGQTCGTGGCVNGGPYVLDQCVPGGSGS